MYMTPELRKGLYSIDPKEIGVDEVSLRSDICVTTLKILFFHACSGRRL